MAEEICFAAQVLQDHLGLSKVQAAFEQSGMLV